MSRSHDGVITHGPCSMKKLRFETRRLDHLLSSVKKNGFQTSSKPDGYLLENSAGDRVFHVIDGNHRVAVVSYMETSDYLVPVRMRVGFPRVVRENDVKRWPAVQMGVLSEEEALRIFNAYFRTTRQSVYDLISGHLEKPTRL